MVCESEQENKTYNRKIIQFIFFSVRRIFFSRAVTNNILNIASPNFTTGLGRIAIFYIGEGCV